MIQMYGLNVEGFYVSCILYTCIKQLNGMGIGRGGPPRLWGDKIAGIFAVEILVGRIGPSISRGLTR